MKQLVFAVWLCLSFGASAQITGFVQTLEDDKLVALPGANIFWKGSDIGTTTGPDGLYEIPVSESSNVLVASFVGFSKVEKIIISRKGEINFILLPTGTELSDVEITARVSATAVDLKRAELSYKIDQKELRKAACCNLSESFETNASVDVSFSDAVTGRKQIEMLGLGGKYALIQRENIPFARGLNASSGLTFVPGPFVESLQLTKGLSSVVNGFESITGQINIELYKPLSGPQLSLNAFGNQGGRVELNAISALDLSERSGTALLLHGSRIPVAQDRNSDGFADIPLSEQYNFTNRYSWRSKKSTGWQGQIGVNAIYEKKEAGQVPELNENIPEDSLWQFDDEERRVEIFGKNGYLFEDPNRSFGFLYSLSYHDKQADFGRRGYRGTQNSIYLNSIYQDILGNTFHAYRTGLSLLAEGLLEELHDPSGTGYEQDRYEIIPGGFFEYTYEPNLRFTLVAGVRADYNSYFEEMYVTPRLNLRYMLSDNTTFRLGGGRGMRTSNVMAENLSLLASNRRMDFSGVQNFHPEVAWNSGASISQNFKVAGRDLKLTADAFYTWFDTKLVADLDLERQAAYLLLSQGSQSFSLLTQLDYELVERLELRLAYKYLNAQEQFVEGLAQSYQVPNNRAFANFSYSTLNQWKFDATLNWFGAKRLPESGMAPAEFQREEFSPDFFTVNAQINKQFANGLEVYAGVNNLLDFTQENPIVSAENPASPWFDSNFVWGPIFGRNIYAGLYYTLPDGK